MRILDRLFSVLIRHPKTILALSVLSAGAWAYPLSFLQLDYDIEAFFSRADPEVAYYRSHVRDFGNENESLLIGIQSDSGIFQESFLQKTDTFTDLLRSANGVKKVISPTNLTETILTPLGPIRAPLLDLENAEGLESDKSRIYDSGIYLGSFFSGDTSAVSILVQLDSGITRSFGEAMLGQIRAMAFQAGLDDIHLGGRISTQRYYVATMKSQMVLLGALGCVLFLVSLSWAFRSVLTASTALLTVGLSITWTFGILALAGLKINLMLTLLPALIIIISTSSTVHLIEHFRQARSALSSKLDSALEAIRATIKPNFYNSLTTSIGFASLAFVPVAPIQIFGLVVAGGILMAFVQTYLLAPVLLLSARFRSGHPACSGSPLPAFIASLRLPNPKHTLLFTAVLMSISGAWAFRLQVNNHFLDDIGQGAPLHEDMMFFEEKFSGIRPFELSLYPKDGDPVMSYSSLLAIDSAESFIRKVFGAQFLFSPASIVRHVNMAQHGGDHEHFRFPDNKMEFERALRLANKHHLWQRGMRVVSEDGKKARITGRIKDLGSRRMAVLNDALSKFLKTHFPKLAFHITGAAELMDNANRNIAAYLLTGIMISVLIATICIGILAGSWKIALISIPPNIIPLLLAATFMAMTGVELKVGTALVFTIIYGIAVDDTIHFINRYVKLKRSGASVSFATNRTLKELWRPMMHSSLILSAGFMSFGLSEFASIANLGIIIAGSLITALMADLIVLPALLKYFDSSQGNMSGTMATVDKQSNQTPI